jgi:hypothetical protein
VRLQSGASADEKGRAFASVITSPELAAYRIIGMMQPNELRAGIDTPTLLETLREQATAVQRGDLGNVESMLVNQAAALQALFVRLAERAMEQKHMPNLDGFMRLALRAQSQCRSTLEALNEIKNPRPVAFVQQANIANGPQQVNNGVSRAGTPVEPNQLSGGNNELPTDTRAPALEGGNDPALEAVGKIYRAENA